MSNGNVYVVYNRIGFVRGVYANEKLAEKERAKEDNIKDFDIKGYKGDQWEFPIVDECKYFTPHLNTIRELISCLYNIEGCGCGGLAHIVTDDENIEDHHIQFVLDECKKEENKVREEVGLVKLICEELLKLNVQERALLFTSYWTSGFCVSNNCENCPIHKGKIYD